MTFDLPAYLARIGVAAHPAPDEAGMRAVHRAHRLAIAFENLDIPLGRGIAIDADSVFAKLVARRRGGYCFEQNRLFLDALHAIGFVARPVLARVWLMAEGVPPRTHTLNLVKIDGQDWIADAGFGGDYTPPMPLAEGEASAGGGIGYRLASGPEGWMLERRADGGEWVPQYGFTLDPVPQADLAMSNHWTSTAPGTRFTTLRVVSRALPAGFASMVDRQFTLRDGTASEQRTIEDADTYRTLLSEVFGLDLDVDEIARLGLF